MRARDLFLLEAVHSRQRGRGGASSPELSAHRFARAMPMRIALPSSPSRASTAFAISMALSRTRGGSLPIAGGYRSVVQGMAGSSEWTIAQRGQVGEIGACETGGQRGERVGIRLCGAPDALQAHLQDLDRMTVLLAGRAEDDLV